MTMRTMCTIIRRRAAVLLAVCGLVVGGVATPTEAFAEPRRLTLDDALATAKKTYQKPIQVDVDRVLYTFDFSLLGIGTGTL